MSNIVKHEQNEIYVNDKNKVVIPPKLPVTKKNRDLYLSTKNFPKIRLIDDKKVVVKNLHSYINATIMDKGVNMPPEEINYLKQRVTDDIVREYNHYSLEEVRLAFFYGVRGELGEYYGLNPVTFFQWLKNFRYDLVPQANKAIEKFLPKPQEQTMSPQDVDRSIAETLFDVYFKLCTTGQYDYMDFGNVGYNLLDSLGLIPFTNEQKIEMMKESRDKFRHSLMRRNRDLVKRDRSIQKIDLKRAFEQLTEQSNPTFEHSVKVGAKRIAIYKFLYGLAEGEVDLKKMLDEALAKKSYEDGK